MLVDSPPEPSADTAPAPPNRRAVRAAGLLVALVLLGLVALASIAIGAKELSFEQVWHGLFEDTGTYGDAVVGERISRTLLGLLAGAALGLAGAVLQALTRNPLADPGLLGINAGASAAVVTAITYFGVTSLSGYVWFAFAGAAAVGALVWFLGGSRGATPVRLALAGTAISAALYGYLQAVMIMDDAALSKMRFWTVGSLASATDGTITQVLPFLAVGTVVALLLARPLNAMAMGDDTARALGADLNRTRALSMAAATVLCGAATAACGPIVFVGLMVPHVVRSFTGPDLRWILPYATVLSPVLLLGADVIGRMVARPAELQVGIVTAILGGPVFIFLVRRRRTAQL
ncbi:iron chelate uptake ABC transporter family permease subunit [Streptomyces caniscabiei]|uniref:Iron chelate uptake ABC transporter family permease subunit n=1 Tax=Streptomyces caniscabiei TaxID=2746961 RepID=A0A927QNS2_9ACTN|nr:iron chelate uptake ABC transporter family permease subunit [Streptomyces caniscabiei]MBD9728217.1 iron chelate uptake ABC transporter family permease subunit [Streptomyces caniscabiei]MDX3509919.1 iron chelate uptake ABC transporter family permease subunit [Streptomyces caniscabiei]MDX3725236.1 iron chelate uptake ABC transporter family permease subunit [Streptomyces caniscabiei]MDX3733815.1 iron chelate uptake ABC transporter family permease subunit [Streptomyces caniscabiei]WEO28007.1 ir